MKKVYFAIIITILLLVSSGCGTEDSDNNERPELYIAAASNLTPAFTELGKLFEEETGSVITFSFGSTGQLTDQIINGAPFDIFAPANVDFVEGLRQNDLIIPDTLTTYAFGRIGMATLSDSSIYIESLNDLLKPEVKKIAIANPEHAPYGLAAKQALESAGLWEQLEDKVVYARNISDALTFVETGNAEVGITALALYKEGEVNFYIIDDEMHAPLEQSILIINRTNEEELAREFIEFIKGSIGRPIMESYGFIVPEG